MENKDKKNTGDRLRSKINNNFKQAAAISASNVNHTAVALDVASQMHPADKRSQFEHRMGEYNIDVGGSYTGTAFDGSAPEQDADDL